MDEAKTFLTNAEIAFSNNQYPISLEWYKKALEKRPGDIYALSRAGALCVSMGQFDSALIYFGRALELDPENGDNAFNYGNACFFFKDIVRAFEMYVAAEKLGCSDDVKPRLYYQMALLCSMRKDIKSALLYIKKCEESDRTGVVSLNPDLISEKLKLHMVQQDFTNAEKCAAQLVAINPTEFKSYMVYFGILMAHKNYAAAQKLLYDAEQYAELTEENRFALTMQIAALYAAKGEGNEAIRVLEERKKAGGLTADQRNQLLLTLAEAYSKNENFDTAIGILQGMLSVRTCPQPVSAAIHPTVPEEDLSADELDEMMRRDMESVQEKIDSGELDANLGLYAVPDYDEEGNLVHYYEEGTFTCDEPPAEDITQNETDSYDLSGELREKVIFTLLSCYLAKDEFVSAQKLSPVLQHSKNKYYSYFGIYVNALTERKLTGDSDTANHKYAEAIAFFRRKTVADANDVLACIFRARLYAEQGKYAKATELAHLLAETDRNAVLKYIEQCKA